VLSKTPDMQDLSAWLIKLPMVAEATLAERDEACFSGQKLSRLKRNVGFTNLTN